jgi:NADPH2:quinone reductase
MRAWIVDRITEMGSMNLRETSKPRASGDQCLLRVEAAGVNFLDTLMMRGQYQVKPPLPFTPGIEVVGTVVERGTDSPYAVGDRICAMIDYGAFAEYAIAPRLASQLIPADMPGKAAVGLPIIYPTAYLALRDRAGVKAGETVLVHAGAGGVGSAAIQLAKHWGATVIATAGGPGKVALCRELGADFAFDYKETGITEGVRKATGGRGVDIVVDPVGGDVTLESLRCLAWGGRLVVVGFAGGKIPALPANRLLLKNAAALGVYWGAYREHHPEVVEEVFRQIFALYGSGVIQPLVRDSFPLEKVEQALQAIASRDSVGKVAILMGGETAGD